MLISSEKLKKLLVDLNLLTATEFDKAVAESKRLNVSIEQALVTQNYLTEDQLFQLIADSLDIPFVKLGSQNIKSDVLEILPENIARDKGAIVFDKDKGEVKVAMSDPKDLETINYIRKRTGLKVKPYLASESALRKGIMLYRRGMYKDFAKTIEENVQKIGSAEQNTTKLIEQLPVVKILNSLIEYAVSENASDIHIEPQSDSVEIRFRVDGHLRDIISLPKVSALPIVARVKYLAELRIDEHRKPQDGRFKMTVEATKLSFRVSIVPTYHGEKVVMRLLPEEVKEFSLEDLGITGENSKIIANVIKSPHGMVLVTGPTGSGKTTTLYTLLSMLNQEDVNISTVEDPIEYGMDRVNQIQVDADHGITFANGLRSILRQDPDIIMIGEIRDSETAEIATHSALTGHLVLTTLHTNDAAGTLPRLMDMGIEPFLIASTVNVAIAQRLVRRLCPNCMESYSLDVQSLSKKERDLDLTSVLEKLSERGVIGKKDTKKLRFYKGKGCEQCGDSGYRGRIGVYEVMEISEPVRDLIIAKKDASDIEKQAIKDGMITMLEDGLQKALEGHTSIDEVLRVVR